MAGLSLQTDALVLLKQPPGDAFQSFTCFSAEHGHLVVLQRLPKKSAANVVLLDLFDEAALVLDSSTQGRLWFVKEARLLARATGIGRRYAALQAASRFAALVARNPVAPESRAAVYALATQLLAALGPAERPDVAYFKALYRFARDEGYPVKQQWFPSLSSADRAAVTALLNRPLAGQAVPAPDVARLERHLTDYLRRETDLILT